MISDTAQLHSVYNIPQFKNLKKGKKTILGSKQKAQVEIRYAGNTLVLPDKFIKNNKEKNAVVVEL